MFENQFNARTYISVPWGEIETIDVIPPFLISPIPIFFAPGFRETPELQKDCIKILFDAGYRVLTCFHPVMMSDLTSDRYPAIELQKARNILSVIEAKNIKKIDLITHSEGAINSTIAAEIQPELFRNLILMTPAGLIGPDTLLHLAWRFSLFLYRTKTYSTITNVVRKERKSVPFLHNVQCGLTEGKAMIMSDITQFLKEIRAKGVKVFIVAGDADNVFPKEKILKKLSKDHYDDFIIKPGGHEVFTSAPSSMKIVLDVLKK